MARLLVLALALTCLSGPAAPVPADVSAKKPGPLPEPPDTEARCTDGSVLRLRILEKTVALKTPYGKLDIPSGRIREIDCATRLSDDIARRIADAVKALGSAEAKARDDATKELVKLGVRAYPALLLAEKSEDAEVRRRSKAPADRVREEVAEEELAVRKAEMASPARITRTLRARTSSSKSNRRVTA